MDRMTYTPQQAYEEDCRRCPRYHFMGASRLVWHQLSPWKQQSWINDPTPREYKDKDALDKRETEGKQNG